MDVFIIFIGVPLAVVALAVSVFILIGTMKGGTWFCDQGFHKKAVKREWVGYSFVYRCPRCGRAIFNK